MLSYEYRKSHCADKTVVRSSYLHDGISYTGKTASLYWIGAQGVVFTYRCCIISIWIPMINMRRLHEYLIFIIGIPTLKRKCGHFDEISITGHTESNQNDNFQCIEWWKCYQNGIFEWLYIWKEGLYIETRSTRFGGPNTSLAVDVDIGAIMWACFQDHTFLLPALVHWNRDIASFGMMTSSNGNIFRVTGHLCGEFTGHRWIPRTKASDGELWCFALICAWINGWVNNVEAGQLRRHRAHYDVNVMWYMDGLVQDTFEDVIKVCNEMVRWNNILLKMC